MVSAARESGAPNEKSPQSLVVCVALAAMRNFFICLFSVCAELRTHSLVEFGNRSDAHLVLTLARLLFS
jgi:hypothetical protein